MRRWPAILALGLLACSQPTASVTPAVKVTPSAPSVPAASPTQLTPPATPTETPNAAPTPGPIPPLDDLQLSTVSFSCRLAVYTVDAGITDWFVSFPDRTAIIDVTGHDGRYYDYAISRWVPVPRDWVSHDGLHYATIEATANDFVLHVFALATGKDTPIHLSFQAFSGQPGILDYSADGIYMVSGFERLAPGLWLVNPSTGQMRQVSKDIYPVLSAGNGIMWAQAVNPGDPHPVVTGTSLGVLPDEIDRVDLRSGTRTVWLYDPGKGLRVIGLDSRGLPLIVEMGSWEADVNARLLLVGQPGSPTSIHKGVIVQSFGDGITDSHGTWLGGQAGIYLYTNSGTLLKVADSPAYASLANGCF